MGGGPYDDEAGADASAGAVPPRGREVLGLELGFEVEPVVEVSHGLRGQVELGLDLGRRPAAVCPRARDAQRAGAASRRAP